MNLKTLKIIDCGLEYYVVEVPSDMGETPKMLPMPPVQT